MKSAITLSSLATLRGGVQFRGEVPYAAGGTTLLLQVRDVQGALAIEEHEVRSLADDVVKPSDFLKTGDIVIRCKGKNHPAVLIESLATVPTDANTVASGYCVVITPERVRPAYLAWYLNQAPAQQYMDQLAIGTVTPILNKKTLGEMPVAVPAVGVQDRIADIFTLQLQEARIAKKLQHLYTLRNNRFNQLIINAIEK